jgi:hypothetical protein
MKNKNYGDHIKLVPFGVAEGKRQALIDGVPTGLIGEPGYVRLMAESIVDLVVRNKEATQALLNPI